MRIARPSLAFRRRPITWLGAALVPLLALSQGAPDGPVRLLGEASLRSAPGGGSLAALLTADTRVQVLERRGEWARVRVEGWVAATSLGAPEPAAATARTDGAASLPAATDAAVPERPATGKQTSTAPEIPTAPPMPAPAPAVEPRPASAAALTGALARVEGRVSLRLGRRKQADAAGLSVLLLPAQFRLEISDDEATQLEELSERARKLQRQADRAMRGSNFTQATWERDRLMRERAEVLDQRRDVLAAIHGRHEQRARAQALGSASTDAQGWFGFTDAVDGSYNVYVRLIDADNDVDAEWLEPVSVSEGIVRVDLDESSAHGGGLGNKE